MSEKILCKKCGRPLAANDRGRYYAQVCEACCHEHGLCQDCGNPIVISDEGWRGFMCSGFHCGPATPVQLEGVFMGGRLHVAPRKAVCPKCGHEFEV